MCALEARRAATVKLYYLKQKVNHRRDKEKRGALIKVGDGQHHKYIFCSEGPVPTLSKPTGSDQTKPLPCSYSAVALPGPPQAHSVPRLLGFVLALPALLVFLLLPGTGLGCPGIDLTPRLLLGKLPCLYTLPGEGLHGSVESTSSRKPSRPLLPWRIRGGPSSWLLLPSPPVSVLARSPSVAWVPIMLPDE